MDKIISLRMLRLLSNLSQEQVAAKIGVSQALISRFERLISIPDYEKKQKLADLFSVSVEDLFSLENQMEHRWIILEQAVEYLSLHLKTVYAKIARGEIWEALIEGDVRIDLKTLNHMPEDQEKKRLFENG